MSTLLARVTSAELAEWQEYARMTGGLRDHRMEIHAAQLMTLLANVHRRKGAPAFKLDDFLPRDTRAPRGAPQPMASLADELRRLARGRR